MLLLMFLVLVGVALSLAAYDSEITRGSTSGGPLIPEEYSQEILQVLPTASAVMSLARQLPNMSRNQERVPVLSGLVTAYFRDGDTGLAQASNLAWKNKYINAGQLVVIVPIPRQVLNDVAYDIWGQVKPRIVEAFGKAFDQAVLYGTNKPSSWPDALLTQAVAASNTVSLAASTDIYDAILGEGGACALVEADGFDVTGHIGALSTRSKLRGLRDTLGQPIFLRSMQDRTVYQLDGVDVVFPRNAAVNASQSILFCGQFDQLVYAMREDVAWRLLDQAVIQDAGGNIVYNLPQQDMVALEGTMRLGWELPNPVTMANADVATRCAFGVVIP